MIFVFFILLRNITHNLKFYIKNRQTIQNDRKKNEMILHFLSSLNALVYQSLENIYSF